MYDDYDAVVYDLDGTLVRLPVDWEAVDAEVVGILREAGVDADGITAWDGLDLAPEAGVTDAVEEAIASREREAADSADRLPLADALPLSVPTAVCSLNCEAAVRTALDRHGLLAHLAAVVGRDTVLERKPHPEPLLTALRELGVEPSRALFVGDSRRDELTAERAGASFRYVEDGVGEL